MRIENKDQITFTGYKSPLKTAFKKGLLPTVKRGIYGKKITPNTVSVEHITPISKGGKNVISNTFLADKYENSRRGNKPIDNYITKENLVLYLVQFMGVKNKYIDGDKYIKIMLRRFKYLFKDEIKTGRGF